MQTYSEIFTKRVDVVGTTEEFLFICFCIREKPYVVKVSRPKQLNQDDVVGRSLELQIEVHWEGDQIISANVLEVLDRKGKS